MWLFEYFEFPWVKYTTAGLAVLLYLFEFYLFIRSFYSMQEQEGVSRDNETYGGGNENDNTTYDRDYDYSPADHTNEQSRLM